MKRFVFTLIIILSSKALVINGQADISNTSFILEKLYTRLLINNNDEDRLKINDSVRSIIDSYVSSDTVFNHKFNNLRYLGQITSPDSLLKIITWNLILQDGINRYYCYFIQKSDSGKNNLISRLTGTYRNEPVRTDTTYSDSDWYGALYYDLRPFRTNDKNYWILLGIDYGNSFITRKIIEIMNFTSDRRIIFGKRWFADGEVKKHRVVLEYGSEAVVTLRFLTDTSIVFDHLVPISPELWNNRQFYGPDYSYDAYIFENGLWRLNINVDARNKE